MLFSLYPFFANSAGAATGLTLADIKITIIRITRLTLEAAVVVDAQPAQVEIGKGYYAYNYDATTPETYDYIPLVEYVGSEQVNTRMYHGDALDVRVHSRSTLGPGAIEWTYTLTEQGTGNPIPDANVWISTDLAGSHIIASGMTDQNGQTKFWLDAGVVYVWRQKSGWSFDNPDQETVSV